LRKGTGYSTRSAATAEFGILPGRIGAENAEVAASDGRRENSELSRF